MKGWMIEMTDSVIPLERPLPGCPMEFAGSCDLVDTLCRFSADCHFHQPDRFIRQNVHCPSHYYSAGN